MSLHFALLNASNSDDDDARQNFHREIDADFTEFDATSGDLPETFGFDAAVITGSRASVYDDERWVHRLADWVGDAVDAGLPMLGVCFGHQLLADVLGGEIRNMGGYEFGYHMVRHADDSRLFEGVDEWFPAFMAHCDEVAELPPGADALAENNYSIQAFRKDRAFGVEFHPEFDLQTARDVMKLRGFSDERTRHVLGEITEENYDEARQAKRIFDNFREYAGDVRAAEWTAPSTA